MLFIAVLLSFFGARADEPSTFAGHYTVESARQVNFDCDGRKIKEVDSIDLDGVTAIRFENCSPNYWLTFGRVQCDKASHDFNTEIRKDESVVIGGRTHKSETQITSTGFTYEYVIRDGANIDYQSSLEFILAYSNVYELRLKRYKNYGACPSGKLLEDNVILILHKN